MRRLCALMGVGELDWLVGPRCVPVAWARMFFGVIGVAIPGWVGDCKVNLEHLYCFNIFFPFPSNV